METKVREAVFSSSLVDTAGDIEATNYASPGILLQTISTTPLLSGPCGYHSVGRHLDQSWQHRWAGDSVRGSAWIQRSLQDPQRPRLGGSTGVRSHRPTNWCGSLRGGLRGVSCGRAEIPARSATAVSSAFVDTSAAGRRRAQGRRQDPSR